MSKAEALLVLKVYQDWRLGVIEDFPVENYVLTEALEVAIKSLEDAV